MKETRASAEATRSSIAEFVPFFKAFCNGTRASIIEYLMSGEKCVCEITAFLSVSQPLISHHLATLRETGFVLTRGQGARTYYALDWPEFERRLAEFEAFAQKRRESEEPRVPVCG